MPGGLHDLFKGLGGKLENRDLITSFQRQSLQQEMNDVWIMSGDTRSPGSGNAEWHSQPLVTST